MLSYEALEDVLTAVLVVLVVAVVVAAAWLSTSVREQPLVATAVVVFHSGGTVEGESGGGGGGGRGGSASEVPGGGDEAAATSAENKDSETMASPGEAGAQVTDTPQEEAAPPRTQECAVGGQNTSAVGDGGDAVDGGGAAGRSSDGECVSSTPEETTEEGTGTTLPPVQSRLHEEVPEMEVRRRRLQHFVSMGGASASTVEDTPITAVDETEQGASSCSGREGPAAVEERLAAKTQTEALQTEAPATTDRQEEGSGGQEEDCKKEEEEVEDKEQGSDETRPPGSIKIRLKFLDETQRYVFAQLTEKVGSFKRQHFSIEQDANRRIRLIFNGQLLSRDSSTLAQYGLFDNCVVHCHVSQPQLLPHAPGRSGEASAQEEEDAYVSRLLAPLLYGVMVVMWYLRYEYGHLFNTMSTIILLFLTALLLISTYLLYITQHVPQAATAATATPVQVTGRTLTHTSSSSASSSTSSSSSMSVSASTAT